MRICFCSAIKNSPHVVLHCEPIKHVYSLVWERRQVEGGGCSVGRRCHLEGSVLFQRASQIMYVEFLFHYRASSQPGENDAAWIGSTWNRPLDGCVFERTVLRRQQETKDFTISKSSGRQKVEMRYPAVTEPLSQERERQGNRSLDGRGYLSRLCDSGKKWKRV